MDDGEEAEVDGRALSGEIGRAHVHEERRRVADDADDDDDRRHVLVDAGDESVQDHVRRAAQSRKG